MIAPHELTRFPVFTHLTEEQRNSVADVARECRYPDAAQLFRAGDPAAGCWVIREGEVTLGLPVRGHLQVVVDTLHHPDVVGWSWLVPPYRWALTATSVGLVDAIELDAVRLRAVTGRDPTLCCNLLLGLFEGLLPRLQSTRARLLDVYASPLER
jgi:CRP/FNR family transcriptional regulator, cyclic AMP receptor protein